MNEIAITFRNPSDLDCFPNPPIGEFFSEIIRQLDTLVEGSEVMFDYDDDGVFFISLDKIEDTPDYVNYVFSFSCSAK